MDEEIRFIPTYILTYIHLVTSIAAISDSFLDCF